MPSTTYSTFSVDKDKFTPSLKKKKLNVNQIQNTKCSEQQINTEDFNNLSNVKNWQLVLFSTHGENNVN